jgi:plastocyanin
MRIRSLAATLALAALAAGASACGSESGQSADKPAAFGGGPGDIRMGDFFYKPAEKTVDAGTKVIFRNVGKIPHTVKGKGFQSRQIDAGGVYSVTLTKPGSYSYICTFHPGMMDGKIVVR